MEKAAQGNPCQGWKKQPRRQQRLLPAPKTPPGPTPGLPVPAVPQPGSTADASEATETTTTAGVLEEESRTSRTGPAEDQRRDPHRTARTPSLQGLLNQKLGLIC